jgi:Dyp-type peroxidase family
VAGEPVLAMNEIQGNVIPGFNKDHAQLLFLRIDRPGPARRWIKSISESITTAQQVWDFRRRLVAAGKQRGDKGTVKSTWINIAFSYSGLCKLLPAADAQFTDDAFRRTRADTDPHVVLIIAGDDERGVAAAAKRIKYGIRAPGPTAGGVCLIFERSGANPEGMRGHEHFGWRDGISQPGIRGKLAKKGPDLTPRTKPERPDQGLPGHDVLWPGEFVFGYPRQNRNNATAAGPDSLKPYGNSVAPEWARNGSYLVFRRLRQDVGAFHRFLLNEGKRLGVDPEALGARLVGRWPSGAPLVRAPVRDKPRLGENKDKNNDFEYGPFEDGDREGSAVPRDPDGLHCPFSAHIRKAYPRDETVTVGDPDPYAGLGRTLNEDDAQTHRLLRRGIPYGPASRSTPLDPVDDGIDRGLLFMAYMTSITNQFEFVEKYILNNPRFKKPNTGVDPMIGQAHGERGDITTVLPGEQTPEEIKLGRWVMTTGGGYFFTPSISALRQLAT